MTSPEALKQQLDRFRDDFETLRREVVKVIVGHEEIIEGTLIALMAGGHVQLEGVPGLGKTLLVKTLSDALHLEFQRIQFTPDLMPANLTVSNVVMETPEGDRRFVFQQEPAFDNLLLSDEINRTNPKTQSTLLEAVQKKTVTVAAKTDELPRPFFVLAKQNPLEMDGTYPLSEAQLDRFFFELLVSFPDLGELEAILDRTTERTTPRVEPVLDGACSGTLHARPPDPDHQRPAPPRHPNRPDNPSGKGSEHRDGPPLRPLRIESARGANPDSHGQDPGHSRPALPRLAQRPPLLCPTHLAALPDPQLRRASRTHHGRRGW